MRPRSETCLKPGVPHKCPSHIPRIGVLAELSLYLEPSDDEGEWICADIGNCSAT